MKAPKNIKHIVEDGEAGTRIDRLLAQHCGDLSRSRITALIKDGAAAIQDRVIKEPSQIVKPGDVIKLLVPAAAPSNVEAEAIALDVRYEDEDLIVVVKPAGMVVHPARGHPGGTLVNALLHHCRGNLSGIGGVLRPGIVHRLDQHVSGVMLAAKNDIAHRKLAAQFTVHSITRIYEAVVYGLPSETSGTIDAPIGRHPRERLRQAVIESGGKRAVSHYRVVEAAGTGASLLQVELETGRTHQIRVHLTYLGHPILGDPLYRSSRLKLPTTTEASVRQEGRIFLHAFYLGFDHPRTGRRLEFNVQAPGIFRQILTGLA